MIRLENRIIELRCDDISEHIVLRLNFEFHSREATLIKVDTNKARRPTFNQQAIM